MNQSTNATISSPTDPPSNEAETMFKVVFYIFLFIFGTTGNLLVMIVIKGKRQRSVNDYFILNLAISDMTFICFSLPFYTYELFIKFVKFQFYCKFVWPMMSVTLFVSIFTLMFMSIERCRAIVFPLKPRIKKASILIGVIIVWIVSLFCILPLMIVANAEGTYCMEKWPLEDHRKAYTIVLFVLQYAIPVVVIAVAYITIAVKLVKTKVPNRTSVNQKGQLVKQKSGIENLHVVRTVAVIVAMFMVCMLPNQIAWLLTDFGGAEHADIFWTFAEVLMFLHSCVNPVIYGSLTRQFREGYVKYIHYICCCGKSPTRTLGFSDFRISNEQSGHGNRVRLSHHGTLKSASALKRLVTDNTSSPRTMSMSYHGNKIPSPKTSPPSRLNLQFFTRSRTGENAVNIQLNIDSHITEEPAEEKEQDLSYKTHTSINGKPKFANCDSYCFYDSGDQFKTCVKEEQAMESLIIENRVNSEECSKNNVDSEGRLQNTTPDVSQLESNYIRNEGTFRQSNSNDQCCGEMIKATNSVPYLSSNKNGREIHLAKRIKEDIDSYSENSTSHSEEKLDLKSHDTSTVEDNSVRLSECKHIYRSRNIDVPSEPSIPDIEQEEPMFIEGSMLNYGIVDGDVDADASDHDDDEPSVYDTKL